MRQFTGIGGHSRRRTVVGRCAEARRLSPYLLEVGEADHGMQVPGPVGESVAVLGRALTAIDEILDAIAWPS